MSTSQQATALPRAANQIELAIGGMTCASCASRIEKKLNRMDGVSATVNYATEKASVTFADRVTPQNLIAAVEKTGDTAQLPPPPTAVGQDAPSGSRPTRCAACVPGCGCRWYSLSRSSPWRWCQRGSSPTGSGPRWPSPARSWSTARCRSTGPPGPTCATARRPWTPSSRWAPSPPSAGRCGRCSSARPAPPA